QGALANQNLPALAIDGGNLKVNPSASTAIQTPGGSQNEVQTLTVAAGGGTFTLTFNNQTTAPIAFNVTAAQVQSALAALSSIGTGNVLVTQAANAYTVTFQGALANQNLLPLTADSTALLPVTGTPAVTVTPSTSNPTTVQTVTIL